MKVSIFSIIFKLSGKIHSKCIEVRLIIRSDLKPTLAVKVVIYRLEHNLAPGSTKILFEF